MEASWVAIVGLGVGLMGHLVATVWWASKITTTLDNVNKNVDNMICDNKEYATKIELAEKLAIRDQQTTALWKKVDYLAEKS